MALAGLFLCGLAAGTAFALRRIAAPMDDLLAGAERVAQGDYTVPVPERGPKEARTLTRAFNSMVSRLNETDTRRRSLLADVSHELRTPLTVIRGNLEGMVDGVYAPNEANLRALIDETQMMERLVEDLRTLALAESGALMLRREPTDLALLLNETAYALQPAQGQALIKVACSDDLPAVLLDPARMREVLTNLLTNAVKHSPPGGEILVTCQIDPANPSTSIVIEVQDQGPGIAPADLPHIFDRFYKSSDSTGMGLGLSIARQLAAAHGGSLEAVTRPAPGACFRIVLPQE